MKVENHVVLYLSHTFDSLNSIPTKVHWWCMCEGSFINMGIPMKCSSVIHPIPSTI